MMEELLNISRVPIFLLSLLYIVSPIDILPEAFLGPIGLIDDVIVLFIGVLPMLSGVFLNEN